MFRYIIRFFYLFRDYMQRFLADSTPRSSFRETATTSSGSRSTEVEGESSGGLIPSETEVSVEVNQYNGHHHLQAEYHASYESLIHSDPRRRTPPLSAEVCRITKPTYFYGVFVQLHHCRRRLQTSIKLFAVV